MWQLTWMFGFIPAWFWNVALIIGILLILVSWTLKFIPFIGTYRLPIQIIGILSLVTSIWFLGAASNEEKWQTKVRELEDKIKIAEDESIKANDKLRIAQAENEDLRRKKGGTIIKYLDKLITKEILKEIEGPERIKIETIIQQVNNCPIPQELIDAHNAAARGDGMKK